MVRSLDHDYLPVEHDDRRRKLLSGIFKPDAAVRVVTGNYYGVCPLVFRPLPARDSEGRALPMRRSPRNGDFTTWRVRMSVVKKAGIQEAGDKNPFFGESFALYNPAWIGDNYPVGTNPYVHAYNRVDKVVNTKIEPMIGQRMISIKGWKDMITGQRPVMPRPEELLYMRALVYQNNEGEKMSTKKDSWIDFPRLYLRKDGKPAAPLGADSRDGCVLVEVKASQSYLKKKNPEVWEKTLDAQLEQQLPSFQGQMTEDVREIYLHPDVCALKDGEWVYAYRASTMSLGPVIAELCGLPKAKGGVEYGDPAALLNAGLKSPDSASNMEPWAFVVRPKYSFSEGGQERGSVRDISGLDGALAANYRSWDSIFDFASEPEEHEERLACIMAKIFKPVPELLEFGWLETNFFARDSVQKILRNRTQLSVGDIPNELTDGIPAAGGSIQDPNEIPIEGLPPAASGARQSVTVPTGIEPGSQALADAALNVTPFEEAATAVIQEAFAKAQVRSGIRNQALSSSSSSAMPIAEEPVVGSISPPAVKKKLLPE